MLFKAPKNNIILTPLDDSSSSPHTRLLNSRRHNSSQKSNKCKDGFRQNINREHLAHKMPECRWEMRNCPGEGDGIFAKKIITAHKCVTYFENISQRIINFDQTRRLSRLRRSQNIKLKWKREYCQNCKLSDILHELCISISLSCSQ